MTTLEIKTIEIVDEAAPMPLAELLDCTHIERTYLVEMVEAGVVTPIGASIEQWTFVRGDLRRVRIAQRLIADLEVNIAGAALVLDLLDEREALHRRVRVAKIFSDDF